MKSVSIAVCFLMFIFSLSPLQAKNAKGKALISEKDKISYGIGLSLGTDFKRQTIEIDMDAFMKGIEDGLQGNDPALTREQLQAAMTSLREQMAAKQKKMQQQMMQQQKQQAGKNLKEGKAFLEANSKKEGVVTLPSGLQYKVIRKGTGATPKLTDRVKTHYKGTLINGTEFDSSYKRGRPATFPVNGVIKGWTDALQLMKTGAKWMLYIPSDLAYGEMGTQPTIGPNSTLIFEIELLEVNPK